MNKEEYRRLYKFEDDYWWFKGHRYLSKLLIEKFADKKGAKILDVGMGTGINMVFLKKYGSVYGCDVSKDAVNFCRKRGLYNVKICHAENLKYKNNSFDIVSSFGALCCIRNDVKALKEMHRVCKPNGILIIETPAIPFLHSTLKTEHDLSQHTIQRHNKKKLVQIVESAGFRIKKISHFNMFLCPLVVLLRIIKKILKPSVQKKNAKSDLVILPSLIDIVLLGVLKFESLIVNWFNLPFGLTLVCIAEKPK